MINTAAIYKDFAKQYPNIITHIGITPIKFNQVIVVFFKHMVLQMLKGYMFNMNVLGSVEVVKVERSAKAIQIDFGATKKARQLNPDAPNQYRTNKYFYEFSWITHSKLLKLYKFKAVFQHERAIPKYEEHLQFKPVAKKR
jgi:hypothetical protein